MLNSGVIILVVVHLIRNAFSEEFVTHTEDPKLGFFNIRQDGLGLVITIPGNTVMDAVILSAESKLSNLTTITLPPFQYTSTLLSVKVPTSTIAGLQTFHRVGDTLININPIPLSTSQFAFGFGWTQVTAVFNVELYYFQPWYLIKPQSGVVTLSFTNFSSYQILEYKSTTFYLSIDNLSMALGQASVGISGFGPFADSGGTILTAFINQNKDIFMKAVSSVFQELLNACLSGMRSIVLP